jgi:hypothetical protein
MNAELSKISTWASENKLTFIEQKSQVKLMTRRRRKENKEVKIYQAPWINPWTRGVTAMFP